MEKIIKFLCCGLAVLPLFANALDSTPFDYKSENKEVLDYEQQNKPSNISCDEIKAQPVEKRVRSQESVRCIFDSNGQVLFNLFQKALLKNPSIEGKIIFDLVILPSGKVAPQTSFSISELKNEKLENDLLSAVKNFDFLPVLDSAEWHTKYSVTFYPY